MGEDDRNNYHCRRAEASCLFLSRLFEVCELVSAFLYLLLLSVTCHGLILCDTRGFAFRFLRCRHLVCFGVACPAST